MQDEQARRTGLIPAQDQTSIDGRDKGCHVWERLRSSQNSRVRRFIRNHNRHRTTTGHCNRLTIVLSKLVRMPVLLRFCPTAILARTRTQTMNSRPPTFQEIDALLAFLPLFSAAGFEPVERWAGGETSGGAMAMPWPQYNPAVEAFMRAAGQEAWSDDGYRPPLAASMLQDADFVGRASLAEIRTMLTYCVRGERFSDGHWAAMIERGYLRRLLERLRQLRQEETP